jgi:hypothetical protein
MPDPQAAGLDPAHIVAICAKATGGRASLAVRSQEGICVCLPSRRTAHRADAALTRIGYQVMARPVGGRDLIVSGWSQTGLETRLHSMRNVVHQLAGHPGATAATVVNRFRALPPSTVSPKVLGLELLDHAHAELRDWVSARSGIHATHDVITHPFEVPRSFRTGIQ